MIALQIHLKAIDLLTNVFYLQNKLTLC